MSERTGTKENIERLQRRVDDLSNRVIDSLGNKIDGYVGIRNLVGDTWITLSDGSMRRLTKKGTPGDATVVTGKDWKFMRATMDAIKLGYLVRDDSLVKSGDPVAETDDYVSPNMVLDEEVKAFPALTPEELKKRFNAIDNSHVLRRIQELLADIDPKPLVALDIVDQRIKILELELPENFYTMNFDQLRDFTKEKNFQSLLEDTKSVHAAREAIVAYLTQED